MVEIRPMLDWHLPYYSSTLIGLFLIFCTEYYNQPILHLWVVYVIFPLLSIIVGDDNINPTPDEEKVLSKQFRWQLPLFSYVVLEWLIFFWSFNYLQRTEQSLIQFLILATCVGHLNSKGTLVSHELFHKKSNFLKFIGTISLVKSLNMHFYTEHIYGHHKYVATPEDPATARLNQTLPDFIKQSLKGGFINSWNREVKNLKKQKKPGFSLENKMIQFIGVEILFLLLILYIYGFKCFLFFVFQAFLSINNLETINYVRHYGLSRKKLENGEYEPVTTRNSWNAPQIIENYLLFKLQRHSDHHANAYKPYQILSSAPDAPSLPCGYIVCLLVCRFPSLWFEIINPLVESTNKNGKPSKEQMEKSTKALRKWMVYEVVIVSLFTYLIIFTIE